MASICNITLFLCMLSAGLCNAADYNILNFGLRKKHELWMAEHGRVYKDEAEKARRFEIFKENVKYIEEFNRAGKYRYKLGLGPFTDLTNDEFAATYASGLKRPESEPEPLTLDEYKTLMEELNLSAAPTSIDWRDQGAVSHVKLQVNCGCCWAMTAAATVEGLIKIKKGVLYNLSVQQLIDCTGGVSDCTGGYIRDALEYVRKNGGMTTMATYPYLDKNTTCDATKAKAIVASIKGVRYIGFSNEFVLHAAVTKQPVGVTVEANTTEFQHYMGGGIYHGPCGSRYEVNHAVTVVGYGEESGTKYWIIKNSWSDKWGESGYMRLERDVGNPDGLCGIGSELNFPKL